MAICYRNILVFIALFHVSIVVAAFPPCQTCGSPNESPPAPKPGASLPEPGAPEASPPELAPIPPPELSPEPSEAPRDDKVFDVTEYDAVADGWTESRLAFLAAWKAACDHPGNSTFYIPEGIFMVAPITFHGPCYNDLSPNVKIKGTLLAPIRLTAFKSHHWIAFKNLKGFAVTGGTETGKVDGQGEAEAWQQSSCLKAARCKKLITSMFFINVSHASISNITLLNGKGFHLGLHKSNDINIYNVNIIAPEDSPNTDGIHVSHSSNISIFSSTIGVGDDCISIGSGSNNISISDVRCGPGHGISVGSLGKYKTETDVVGISVRNCTINGTENGIRMKSWPGGRAINAYNMTFEDILMINVSNPIVIDQEYCPSHKCKTTKPSLVKVKDILIRNISGTYNTKSAVTLLCSSDAPCEDIRLVNISLNYLVPHTPRQGRFNIKGFLNGLQVINSKF
ncbi:exopolygalacturonase-like [Hibiscus syriacus]|uniref:exopolygalacturonase-like n=1 Tax=Hibiscus syriacus TaxID=106335 RepID=UPI00192271DA|nr:exopolygalacturonase-like [Hibiscus syriacus]